MSFTTQQNMIYAKNSLVWNLSTCDCEIAEYLKIFALIKSSDSLITCDEIKDTSETVSMDSTHHHQYKKWNEILYFHTVLLVAVCLLLLLIIVINWSLIETKNYITTLIKMVMTNELKESDIKNYPCHYFDDMISISDLDFENILLGKK